MTVEEMKDSLDKMIQDYPFVKESEVLIKIINGRKTEFMKIDFIETDRCCRPLIVINN